MANNPVLLIDPDGKQIIGGTRDDINKAKEDIFKMFEGDKFNKFKQLIQTMARFKAIGKDAMNSALEGVAELSNDEKALVDLVTNTINSERSTCY